MIANALPTAPLLTGVGVVITRPATSAARLSRLVTRCGGTVLPFHVLEIRPLADPPRPPGRYDWIIFISANAVQLGASLLGELDSDGARVAAVGAATAAALEATGRGVDLVPAREFSSAGLLAAAPLQSVVGQRMLIVRGRGGQETLADNLRQRGATVDYFECYERCPVRPDAALLRQWRDDGAACVVTLTSSQVAEAFCRAMPPDLAGWLNRAPLACLSEAVLESARLLGAGGRAEVARAHDDDALLAAVLRLAGRTDHPQGD